MDQDLNALTQWRLSNKLAINIQNTNYIITQSNTKNGNNQVYANNLLFIGSQPICRVSDISFLRIMTTENITWGNHI